MNPLYRQRYLILQPRSQLHDEYEPYARRNYNGIR